MAEIDMKTLDLLNDMGFEISQGQPKLYQKIIDENTVAYVDFRKQNGRRFAKRGDDFVDDPDSIEALRQFKEERDKILKSSSDIVERQNNTVAHDAGQKEEPVLNSPIHTSPSGVKLPPAPTSNLLRVIKEDYEADILEIFGDSGACKTKLAVLLALEGKRDGKKVRFVDTERNLRKAEIQALGDSYQYLPGIVDIDNFCKKLPSEPDVIIIDSVGYPLLTEWARLTSEKKGEVLTKLIAWKGELKDWAINGNKLVIITNQPDSDFMKGKDYINRPFGDKARFASKEIWVIERLGMQKGVTRSAIRTFRSRIKGYGLDVAQIEINDQGTILKGICVT